MTSQIVIDGESLDLRDVVAVARERASVGLHDSARERLARVRRIVDDIVARNEPVYGVNTGFGKLSDIAIPPGRLAELQTNLVRSHAAGVGAPLPEDEARAVMLLRANVLAKGRSGIRPEVVDLLLALLNAGLYPPIPEQGSVGASGDLAPLAHLALALLGEGMLLRDGEAPQSAKALLAAAGLASVELGPKEGLALINGTQAHTGIAALALWDARGLWATSHVSGAATLEALLGTPVAFDARIHEVRGQPGQMWSATLFRSLTAESAIRESHRINDPRVQDAYALRCMPQVMGPVHDALEFAEGVVARELNAATDNPLVFDDGVMLSGGNFHGQAVGMACDFVAIALTNLGTMAERRIDRLVNPDLNQGLPPFLARDAGVHSGYMIAQVTAAALASECKVLSHPASVDSIPTDGGKEDYVPMAMSAAVKLRRIVHNVRHILAIELLCAIQGLEFRRPLTSSAPVERAYALLRGAVPSMDRDRVVSTDIAAVATQIARGAYEHIVWDLRDTSTLSAATSL
ncbi:MAG: histidine ammonia-lyase [Gemmatimonadaceae bacterium]|nr:histidine ammonia-lyase [Gemmatimonadaceae bacterium]